MRFLDLEGLTRFEQARIISARALQLAMGAPALVDRNDKDSMEIARKEFKEGIVPLTVKVQEPAKLEE